MRKSILLIYDTPSLFFISNSLNIFTICAYYEIFRKLRKNYAADIIN